MPKTFLKSLALFATLMMMSPTNAASETYTFDPLHTAVQFHINHFGFSNPSGKWLATGQLVLDEKKLQNSTVNVSINVAKVNTGIAELDKHLNSELFFNTRQFPTATFVSKTVERTGKERALVHGTLTLRGISKPVTLKVKLNKKGVNPLNKKPTIGFTATTTLSRAEFGMKTLLPGLGNEVQLDIEAEANSDKSTILQSAK